MFQRSGGSPAVRPAAKRLVPVAPSARSTLFSARSFSSNVITTKVALGGRVGKEHIKKCLCPSIPTLAALLQTLGNPSSFNRFHTALAAAVAIYSALRLPI